MYAFDLAVVGVRRGNDNGQSCEVNLHRLEITEAAIERLPRRDFGDAGACAGEDNLPFSKAAAAPT